MQTQEQSQYVQVRIEEVLIGGLITAAIALLIVSAGIIGTPTLWAETPDALAAWIAMGIGFVPGAWWVARQERDTHLRGARFYPTASAATAALQAGQTALFSDAQKARTVKGVVLAGIELARKQETRHFSLVGQSGGGKTVVVNSLIDQIIERGDRAIIHDLKGDFVERYYDSEKCVIVGPWDDRASIWDAAADINSSALADEFATAAVQGGLRDGGGKNAFFYNGAAILLAGLIRSYQAAGKRWTWADIDTALEGSPIEIIQRAALGSPKLVKMQFPGAFGEEPKLDKSAPDVISTLSSSALPWILRYAAVDRAHPDAPRFSFRNWLLKRDHADVRVVILNFNRDYESAAASIFGSMLNAIAGVLTSPEMPEIGADDSGLWAVLDEAKQLGAEALRKIQTSSELGRSRGVRVLTAWQDQTQAAATMGAEQAAPILQMQGVRIYTQCSNAQAELVCKQIGSRDVLRIETTAEAGAVAGKSKKITQQQVLVPSDLLGLHEIPKVGMQVIVHIGDTLGRLVQLFPPKTPEGRVPKFVPSEAWQRGSLPRRAEAAEAASEAAATAPVPTAVTDDDTAMIPGLAGTAAEPDAAEKPGDGETNGADDGTVPPGLEDLADAFNGAGSVDDTGSNSEDN